MVKLQHCACCKTRQQSPPTYCKHVLQALHKQCTAQKTALMKVGQSKSYVSLYIDLILITARPPLLYCASGMATWWLDLLILTSLPFQSLCSFVPSTLLKFTLVYIIYIYIHCIPRYIYIYIHKNLWVMSYYVPCGAEHLPKGGVWMDRSVKV